MDLIVIISAVDCDGIIKLLLNMMSLTKRSYRKLLGTPGQASQTYLQVCWGHVGYAGNLRNFGTNPVFE